MPCSRANFVELYINDSLWGLYTNVEAVNKPFIGHRFGEKYGPFFKCNPEDLDITPGGENSNLSSTHGTDSLNYTAYYDMRSDRGWSAFYGLIDTLNNHPARLEHILDVDRALWMHAINYALVNFDSYVGYGQNYYLYRGLNGQFFFRSYGSEHVDFGSFRLTDASSEHYNGFDIAQAQQMDPLIHHKAISIAPRPLMRNLFAEPRYRRMYLAHIRTIIEENIQNQYYRQKALALRSQIDSYVQKDPHKFYTYSDFISNLDSQVALPTGDLSGHHAIDGRKGTIPKFLSGVQRSACDLESGQRNAATWRRPVDAAEMQDASEAIIKYRFGSNQRFSEASMHDDGLHNDGQANDGIFGVWIPEASNHLEYYLYAENDSSGVFSPKERRTAFTLWTLQCSLGRGDQRADVGQRLNCRRWQRDLRGLDRALQPNELSPFDRGSFLSDTLDPAAYWPLPAYSIPPESYLIIWADDDTQQGVAHASFKLSKAGTSLYLLNSNELVLDSVTLGPLAEDVSFARFPNGTGSFAPRTPTFRRSNDESAPPKWPGNMYPVYPNPFLRSHLSGRDR